VKKISAYKAQSLLSRLLDEVARGEKIVITKHGVPIAMLVPCRPTAAKISDVIAQIKELRGTLNVEGTSISELIEEGRFELITSSVVEFELKKTPDPERISFVANVLSLHSERIGLSEKMINQAKEFERRNIKLSMLYTLLSQI
jgi:prevent-host-death family protein